MSRQIMLPEFEEWELARKWIRKNCRIRWFRRDVFTTIGLDGQCGCLEIYPDGDCAFRHWSTKNNHTTSIIHGYDYFAPLSLDDEKFIHSSEDRKDGFVAPKNARCDHINKGMLIQNLGCVPLVKFSENWWRFRHEIKLDMNLGPLDVDLVRCGMAKEEDFAYKRGLVYR